MKSFVSAKVNRLCDLRSSWHGPWNEDGPLVSRHPTGSHHVDETADLIELFKSIPVCDSEATARDCRLVRGYFGCGHPGWLIQL